MWRGRRAADDDHDACDDADGDGGPGGEIDAAVVCAVGAGVVVADGGGVVAYAA